MSEGIPDKDAPIDLTVARLIARRCVDALVPDSSLHGFWEGYLPLFDRWWDHGVNCGCNLDTLRFELEDCRGLTARGDLYLESLKLALSAVFLARENPYFGVASVPADIETLIRHALDLLVEARRCDDSEPTIAYDRGFAMKLHKAEQQGWLEDLMERAYIPEAADAG